MADPSRPTRLARRRSVRAHRTRRWRGLALVTAAVLVVAAALVGSVAVIRRHVEQGATAGPSGDRAYAAQGAVLADQATADGFLAGVAPEIPLVTSYDYRDLDAALGAGLAVSTGTFRTAYRAALQGSVGVAARRDRLVQTFEVLGAGIGEISADGRTAKVLVFGVETLTGGGAAASARRTPRTLTATVVRRADRYLISRLAIGANAGLPPGSPELAVAAEAARRELVALLSYRRTSFDADFRRALAGTVDPLRSTLPDGAAASRVAMNRGRYDLTGAVTAVAVRRASGSSLVLLMAATGSRVAQDGSLTVDDDARVSVTVVRTSGGWRLSDVQPVAA